MRPHEVGARLLVVDDHEEVVTWLCEELSAEGYLAAGCTSPLEAVDRIVDGAYDLVIADVEMPQLRGLDLMARVRQRKPDQLVVLITAFGSVDLAVQAVRAGACDFLTKPFTIEALLLAVERALRGRPTRRPLVRRTRDPEVPDGLVARSAAMREVLSRAERAAKTRSPVLLTGETGVGKGTIARYIHARGPRASRQFVQINCAGIPTHLVEAELFGARKGAYTDATRDRDGLFVRADGGTLFLDEVGELVPEVQPKLLDVLENGRIRPLGGAQERTVDVRIVAATNRDLEDAVRERTFRADLLFRLDVIRIEIPPLRDRPEDLEGLVELFLNQLGARLGRTVGGVHEDARRWLASRRWAGNVRELANLLEQAVALGEHDIVTLDDLRRRPDPPATRGWTNLEEAVAAGATLDSVELDYMRRVLRACDGNVSEAARRLGIDRRTLHRRLADAGAD